MHEEIEEEIEEFYQGPYQKPVLGSKEVIGRVKQRLGDKARVEKEKPESRRLFSPSLDEIVAATAREYGKAVEELNGEERRGKRARMVAIISAGNQGGTSLKDRQTGDWETSSVSSAIVRKVRVAKEEGASPRVGGVKKRDK